MGRTRRSHRAVVALIVAAVFAAPAVAHAEPGDLDATYGTCGVVASEIPGGDELLDVVPQPDGRVLEVRITLGAWIVTRRRANGTLDPSYGVGGVARIARPGPTRVWVHARLDPQGRLVLSEEGWINPKVFRLTANGAFDQTFGAGGTVTAPPQVRAPTFFPNGDLAFLVGNHYAIRMNPAGVIDPGWQANHPGGGTPTFEVGAALADGDYLALGSSYVYRFDQLGALRPGYPKQLLSTVPGFGTLEGGDARHIIPLPDGGAITATDYMSSLPGIGRFGGLVLRAVRPDGTLDPGFGSNGTAFFELASTHTIVSGHHANGRTWVGVRYWTDLDDEPEDYGGVLVLLPDGRADPQFGVGGRFILRDAVGLTGLRATTKLVTLGLVGQLANGRLVSFVLRLRRDALTTGAGLVLDWSGTLWPTRLGTTAPPQCPLDTPFWPDADLARGVTAITGKGGYVVDAYGGLHAFSIGPSRPAPARAVGGPYWPGWDIVRGVAARADGRAGYVLDGWGGLHRFRTPGHALPATTRHGPYWRGFDIARDVALMPDARSGFVLDGYGGLHPFSVDNAPLPPRPRFGPYWYGWDIARGVSILPDGTGGYILDGYGGIHPFALGNRTPPPKPGPGAPYDTSDDWARGFAFVPPITGAADAPAAPATDGPATTDIATLDDAVVRVIQRPSSPRR